MNKPGWIVREMTMGENAAAGAPFLAWNSDDPTIHISLVFTTPDDFLSWLNRELEAFAWIDETLRGGYSLAQPVTKTQVRTLNQMKEMITRLMSEAPNEGLRDQILGELRNRLQHHFVSSRALYSQTETGQFVMEVARGNAREAIHLIWYFLSRHHSAQQPLPGDESTATRAKIRGVLFELGITGDLQPQRELLAQLSSLFQERINDLSEQTAASRAHNATAEGVWSDFVGRTDKEFKDAAVERKRLTDDAFDHAKGELKSIETTFRQKLALQASVEYWKDRAAICRERAKSHAWKAVTFVLLYFAALAPLLYSLLVGLVFAEEVASESSTSWKVGVIAFLLLMGLWLTRIIVRLYLSNSHLAVDAEHRSVVVLTYLSMLRDEKDAVTPAERQLVLGTVFRPASDGLIRDDAMPPTTAEIASRLLEGRRG